MSASIDSKEPGSPLLPATDARSRRDDAVTSLSRQLAVVREMLPTLDTLTAAGQQHIMSKVVAFIQNQATRLCRSLSRRNQEMFAELLGHLTRESRRLLPDVRIFSHRAESLLALLGAIA